MSASLPAWREFDTESLRVLSMTDKGRVVLLAVSPDFLEDAASAQLAVDLARDWAACGQNVVLADGCIDDPRLHQTLGLSNQTGLTDVLYVGTPLEDVLQTADHPGFKVVSAGFSPGNPHPPIGHERWKRLTEEVDRARMTLAVLTPLDSEIGQRCLARCTDIVVLAAPGEHVEQLFPGDLSRVREVLGPTPGPRGERSATRPASGPRLEPHGNAMPKARGAPQPLGTPPADAPVKAPAATQEVKVFELFASEHLSEDVDDPVARATTVSTAPTGQAAASPRPAPPAPDEPAGTNRASAAPTAPEHAKPPEPAESSASAGEPEGTPAAVAKESPAKPTWRSPDRPPDPWREAADHARQSPRSPVDSGIRRVPDRPLVVAPHGFKLKEGRPPWFVSLRWLTVLTVAAAGWIALTLPGSRAAPEPVFVPSPPASTSPGVSQPAAAAAAVGLDLGAADLASADGQGPHQRFSISVAAFPEASSAAELARELGALTTGHLVAIVPVEVGGRVFHRVLAGIARERSGLASIRTEIEAASGLDGGSWLLRDASLAFALGDLDSRAAAELRSADLLASGIPSYILQIPVAQGTTVHRVYAGAFANAEESSHLAALLQQAGVREPRLVERRGFPIR